MHSTRASTCRSPAWRMRSGRTKSSSRPTPRPTAMPTVSTRAAFAIAAHPDDIEFYMAGSRFLLKQTGWAIHYMTRSSGSCGSARQNAATLRRIRRKESQAAAKLLGAQYHASIADDLEIFYEKKFLRQ